MEVRRKYIVIIGGEALLLFQIRDRRARRLRMEYDENAKLNNRNDRVARKLLQIKTFGRTLILSV